MCMHCVATMYKGTVPTVYSKGFPTGTWEENPAEVSFLTGPDTRGFGGGKQSNVLFQPSFHHLVITGHMHLKVMETD